MRTHFKKMFAGALLAVLFFNIDVKAQWTTSTPLNTSDLYTNGKVGIGTSSPGTLLHLSNSTLADFQLETTSGSTLSFRHTQYYSTWFGLTHPYILQAIDGSGTSDMVFTPVINTPASGLVIKASGNVGIGTTSPSARLHVGGSIISNSSITDGGSDFILGTNDGRSQGSNTANRAMVHNDDDILTINYAGDFEGGVQIGGDKGLFIGDINTLPDDWSGTYKLYVIDGILTEKVKVAVRGTANWSDFVFDKSYKLMPLAQVEKFIGKNKHLPDVPSAEEMVTNGLDVATMDAKLLQKIEELTLYMIEIKKQNEKLINDTERLEKEVEILKEKK